MCRDLMERLTDYLDGAVSDAERAAIDAHLAACDGCTEAVEQFRMTIRSVGSLRLDDVAALEPGLRDRLLDAFRAGSGGPDRGSS
jgi:anti-sigma factor RsiW